MHDVLRSAAFIAAHESIDVNLRRLGVRAAHAGLGFEGPRGIVTDVIPGDDGDEQHVGIAAGSEDVGLTAYCELVVDSLRPDLDAPETHRIRVAWPTDQEPWPSGKQAHTALCRTRRPAERRPWPGYLQMLRRWTLTIRPPSGMPPIGCASSKPHPTLSCYYDAFHEAAEKTRGRAWFGDGSERSDVGFGSKLTLLWNAQPSAIKWRSCSAQGRDIRGSVRGIDCSGPAFPDIGCDGARRWSLFRPRLSCAGTDNEAAACASCQGFGAAGDVVDRESMPRFAT